MAKTNSLSQLDIPIAQRNRVLVSPGRKLPNWLQAYAEYTTNNEAAPIFHLWGGIGALSAVTGKQVCMDLGKVKYLTNMYTVLVGPPGSKKSTAMRIARGLVKAVPGIHLAPSVGSPEALIKRFVRITDTDHQSMTVYALELGTFLGEGLQQRHLTDFLCEFFDGEPDFEKETIIRGVELLTNPWFAFQACTTPEWLQGALSSRATDGGLFSRTLWIYNEERRLNNPWPSESPAMLRLRSLLINDLTHISTITGNFTATDEARDWYVRWYQDPKRFPHSSEQRLGGYYDRKSIHLIKLAMLLSLADNDSLVLTLTDMQAALACLDDIEPDMQKAFVGVGKNPQSTDSERIYKQIQTAPNGLAYSKIIAANFHANSQEDIDKSLNALRVMGKVKFDGGIWRVTSR